MYRLPLRPRFADAADPEPDLAVTACLHALADLWFERRRRACGLQPHGSPGIPRSRVGARGTEALADAAKAASAARNLAPTAALRVEAGRRGVRAAAEAGLLHLAAYHLVGLAAALTEESMARPGSAVERAAAYTALEAAARHLRDAGPYREQAERQLQEIARALDSRIARALVWLAGDVADDDDSESAAMRRALSSTPDRSWELDDRELAAALPLIASLVPAMARRSPPYRRT